MLFSTCAEEQQAAAPLRWGECSPPDAAEQPALLRWEEGSSLEIRAGRGMSSEEEGDLCGFFRLSRFLEIRAGRGMSSEEDDEDLCGFFRLRRSREIRAGRGISSEEEEEDLCGFFRLSRSLEIRAGRGISSEEEEDLCGFSASFADGWSSSSTTKKRGGRSAFPTAPFRQLSRKDGRGISLT